MRKSDGGSVDLRTAGGGDAYDSSIDVVKGPPGTGCVSDGTALSLSEKRSGAKLEKTSLSTGGFQWVPYGYIACPGLRFCGL